MSNIPLKKVDSISKRSRYVWTDEIVDDVRHIYMRCFAYGCAKIFEIGNKPGTVITPLMISEGGSINTCLICPHCDNHLFVVLEGYERIKGVKDVFKHQ